MALSHLHRVGCMIPPRVRVQRLYTAFEDQYDAGFYFDGEAHDYWEMVFVADGVIGVTSGSEVYTVRRGQIILHAPMTFHRLWAAENTAPAVVIFSFSADGLTTEHGGVRTLSAHNAARVFRVLELICAGYEMDEQEYIVMQPRAGRETEAGKAACMLEYLLMSALQKTEATDTRDESLSTRQYREIIAVMGAHVSEPLTVLQIAQMCKLSESGLKKIFARYVGIGVMRYFTEMKIRRAMLLLQRGERICDVSEQLGFDNQNYFSTVFRRVTGMSPSQFRKAGD